MTRCYYIITILTFLFSCKSSPRRLDENNTLEISGRYCSAFDSIDIKGKKIMLNPATQRQKDQISKILNRISLPLNFLVYQGNVNNAIALFQSNQNYIILNRQFLNDVDKRTDDYWLSMYLIGHEIGHLLSSHLVATMVNDSISKEQELQADYFAGAILSRLGCTLKMARLIFNGNYLQNSQGSKSHPPTALRIKSVEEGWENNLKGIFTEADPPLPDNIDLVDDKQSNYTFSLRDLSPLSVEDSWIKNQVARHDLENIGEGVIVKLELLEQEDMESREYDDYGHTESASDSIERMMPIYPVLHYSATIKVRKWIRTSDITENVSYVTAYFLEHEIQKGNHMLDKYLDLFRFAYNETKMNIYKDHFVVGQPIEFTIEMDNSFILSINGQDQDTYCFKEIKFLAK